MFLSVLSRLPSQIPTNALLTGIGVYCLQYGETPLHMAAKNGCSESARLLLTHGASLEAKANASPLKRIALFVTQIWTAKLYSLSHCNVSDSHLVL